MKYYEKDAELKPLREQLEGLELQAGITKEMERARDGNFMPLGIDGEDVSPDEYFADEHDGVRHRVRSVYFGVSDLELRKKLVTASRDIARKIEHHSEADLRDAQGEVAKAKAATHRHQWGLAAVIAVSCVAIGYKAYEIVGALAGAVGGFFLAQGTVKGNEREAAAALEQAELDLADLKKSLYVNSLSPETFSKMEQLTGQEDQNFGAESAHSNVIEFEQRQKAKRSGGL